MRMEHPQRVHSDCLLVPSESTLSRKEGHTRRPEGPRTHHEQSTVSPWVMVQSACLAGAWCGNVIPGVNTGLLTSEGCSPPWTPHSRKETHFDAPPPRSDGKTCKACRVHTHAACIGTVCLPNHTYRAQTGVKGNLLFDTQSVGKQLKGFSFKQTLQTNKATRWEQPLKVRWER